MTHPGWATLRTMAFGWAVAFPLLALGFRLNLFADGALFSYAAGVGDSWNHHWRNIAGRAAVYLLAVAPAERLGAASGSVAVAERGYAALFHLWPLLGLLLVERFGVPAVRRMAWLSAATLLPFVFPFPTEMWLAQGAIWPALALLSGPATAARRAAGWGLLLVACLSHEAGLAWGGALLATLRLMRVPVSGTAVALAAIVALWGAVRLAFPPDPYTAEVLAQNAGRFLSLELLSVPLLLLGLAAMALAAALGRWWPVALAGAAVPWLDGFPVHAWDRYTLRSLLFAGVPALMLLAGLLARRGATVRLPSRALAALLVLGAVHASQLARFVSDWTTYLDQARAGRMVAPLQETLGWNSTTPFLSVMLAPGFAPARLLVDPDARYVWFGCAVATRAVGLDSPMPVSSRALVRGLACRARPE